jgi:hypothetical protein
MSCDFYIMSHDFNIMSHMFVSHWLQYNVTYVCILDSWLLYNVTWLLYNVTGLQYNVTYVCILDSWLLYNVTWLLYIHVIELLCYNWRFANFWLEIWSRNWRFFIDIFDACFYCLLMFSFCLFQYWTNCIPFQYILFTFLSY